MAEAKSAHTRHMVMYMLSGYKKDTTCLLLKTTTLHATVMQYKDATQSLKIYTRTTHNM